MLKLGLTSVTFRELSADDIINYAKKCSLSAIEWGSDAHVLPGDTKTAEAVKEKTISAGICVSSYGSYFRLGKNDDINVTCATLDMPECGLKDEVLDNTDVLIWWGHVAHEKVPDEIVEKIHDRILRGMGLIVLHSGHFSKILRKTLGTTCSLKWREGDRERVWNIAPNHPITQGLGEYFYLEHEEMYGERFDVPDPDELVLIGWFGGGEVFRSGCVWNRGL